VELIASSSDSPPFGIEAIDGAWIVEGRTAAGIDESDFEIWEIFGRECVSSALADEVKTAAEIPKPRTMTAPADTNLDVVENFSMITPFIKLFRGGSPFESKPRTVF
jgi:hypothetical protein